MSAAEYALIWALDYSYVVCEMLKKLLGCWREIEAFVDRQTLRNVIAKDSATAKCMIQTDNSALK